MKIKLNNIFKNKKQKKEVIKKNKLRKGIGNNAKNIEIRNIYTREDSVEAKRKNNTSVKVKKFKVYDNSKKDDVVEKKEEQEIKIYTRKGASHCEVEQKEEVEEVKEEKKIKKIPKAYFFLLLAMIGLAVTSVTFNLRKLKNLDEEDYTVFNNTDKTDESSIATANPALQDNHTTNNDTNSAGTENKKEVVAAIAKVEKKEEPKKVTVKPLAFSKPLDGEIIKIYSIDKVIYSKTLELWKIHDGIDIKADEGSVVKSIEKGNIEKIYSDPFYGYTIVIDHGQGYKSCYSNLSEKVLVKAKQTINKGTKIGYIGNTAIGEIKDDSHLHFMLFLNNENVDPTSIFK
ncbi:MAG: M23 family metallopeptidase [Clostridia bacterium]|nr:M23 family metallopeptidase [Clostridia bacterium]